jgi:hypothetical protein
MRRSPERKALNVEIALAMVSQMELKPDTSLGTEVSLMDNFV